MKKIVFLFVALFLVGCAETSGMVEDYIATTPINAQQYHRKAIEKYGNAEQSNDGQKITALGNMYFWGFGVPKNITKSEQLYHKAAMLGYAPAFCNLADEEQNKGRKGYKQALNYLNQAIVASNPACGYFRLGIAYFDGYGVEPNIRLAKEYLNKAISMGDNTGESELYLGIIAINQENYDEAKGWLAQSERKNNENAKYFLAEIESNNKTRAFLYIEAIKSGSNLALNKVLNKRINLSNDVLIQYENAQLRSILRILKLTE